MHDLQLRPMSSKKRTDGRPRGTSPSKRRKSEGNDALAWTDSGVQVLLPGGERITITGTGTVAVHSGEIDVAGHRMSASSRPLHFSVDNSSPVVITAVAAEAQVPLAGSRGAVFSISHPPNSNTVSSASADLDVHLVGDPGNPHSFQELPESWRQGAGELCASVDAGLAAGAPPAVIAICGGKNVGKSSFARLLVSMLLNRHHTVAYLDTDVGQPEFTPSGLVSLFLLKEPILGAPHTHQRTPDHAHFFGEVSPAVDPQRYVQSVQSMYAWYCRHASTAAGNAAPPPPLVVNTHGWVKGFGFDVLVDMLRTLSITHSVHIMSPNPRRNLPQGAFWKEPPGEGMTEPASGLEPLILEVPALVFQGSGSANGGNPSPSQPPATELEGATPPAPQRTGPVAVEQRALQWMAFANACCTAAADGSSACHPTEADVGDRLAAAPPLEVSLDAITVRVLYTAVPPAEAARVLNGAVVGLCKGIAPATSSKLGVCLGLGIVRAVDVTARKAYVLTPLSPAELEHVEVFEVGRLELPPALLQTKKFLSPYVALHSLAASGTGAGVIKSRNNLLRARQQGG